MKTEINFNFPEMSSHLKIFVFNLFKAKKRTKEKCYDFHLKQFMASCSLTAD